MAKRLTEKELAERWGVSTRTCQKWRNKGIGPAFLIIGQHTVLYREEDVLAYEKAKRQGGEALPEPEGWRDAMVRAAACLDTVSNPQAITPDVRSAAASIRDEIRAVLAE